jgi:sulfur-oxidizing protein SoxY
MSIPRRTFLKGVLVTSSAMAIGTSLLPPAVMADWPEKAFLADTVEDALKSLFLDVETSDKITINAPAIAENGAVVPVEVTADLPKVESITVIAEENPKPLIAKFNFAENAESWIKTRIKMAETSNVIVVVKADGKLYTARRLIKVTIGGCGG